MPIIPVYKRKVSIPGEGANAFGDVRSAGMVGDALERSGNELTNQSNQFAQILKKQEEEKDQIDKIKYTTDYSNLLNQYEIDKRSNEQGELAIGITNRSVTNLESMANDYLEKNIPERIRPQMGAIFKQLNSRSLDQLTTFEIHQREVYRGQTAKNAIEAAAGQIASYADSPIDINNTLADTIAKLESLKVPQFEIDKASSGLVSIAIETNSNNGNFKEAESLINEHKELLDAHGVRDTMVNMIKTKRKQAEILAKEAQEDAINATNQSFQNKYLDGQLNTTDVLNSNLDENGQKEWINQLKSLPKSFKTDPEFYSNMWDKVNSNPESITDREIMAFMGHGLSKADAKGLIAERNQALKGDPQRQEAIKEVLNELKIDKAEGTFGKVEYLKQVETFKRWLKVHPDKEPEEYREKVLAPRAMSQIQKILDWIPFVNPGERDVKKTREEIEAELKTTPEVKKAPNSRLPEFNFKIKDKEEQKKVLSSIEGGKVPVRIQVNPKYPNKKRMIYRDGTYDEFTVGV